MMSDENKAKINIGVNGIYLMSVKRFHFPSIYNVHVF